MNLKDVVRKVAPALANLLAGPAAGTVVKQIAGAVLGRDDATEDEIAAAILTGSPETMLKLKELEQNHAARMAELGIKYEEIDAADRANARAREIATKDRVPSILAFLVMSTVPGVVYVLMFKGLPPANKDSVFAMLQLVNSCVSIVLGYYFGSSRGSSSKDESIRQLAAK